MPITGSISPFKNPSRNSMSQKSLNASTLALINVAAICNIKNFPIFAEYGLSIIFYLILSSIFFFLPVAFVSAELSSAWPERGVYTWVKEALGERAGFIAVWLQWVENVIWYPTILSFIAGSFAYLFDPSLAQNNYYILAVILATFWIATVINFSGMKVSGWISSISAFFGTLLPMALIIALGAAWLLQGHPSQIEWSWKKFFPDLTSINELVLLSGVLLGLAGMEMSAVHAKDVRNPQKDYPKGIFLSALLILLFSAFGALSIAALIPASQIELASGSMEAFRLLLDRLGLGFATPLVACVITLGALGMMSTWIVGPTRGLLAAAEDGDLPPVFQTVNRNRMPTFILSFQACIVTVLSSVFIFMPSVNSSYWALIALTVILYQIMYFLMFVSAIVLRKKHPLHPRPYKIPFGEAGIWICCICGMIGSVFGLVISFFPPSQFDMGHLFGFESFLIGGCLFFFLIPLYLFSHRKPSWKKRS